MAGAQPPLMPEKPGQHTVTRPLDPWLPSTLVTLSSWLSTRGSTRPLPRIAETGVPFPFPPELKRYLHKTSVVKGHENAGPLFCLRPSPQTILGLEPFMLKGGRPKVGQLQLPDGFLCDV